MMDVSVLSVSDINQAIKQHIEASPQFGYVLVQGEVSNLREQHGAGHLYFTLKDDDSKISAVMFASSARRMKVLFRDGDHIKVEARVTVYEKTGSYQLLVTHAEPLGIGALFIRFEQLKKKLLAQGLFDEAHKVSIPRYPQRIAIITAPTGAAVRDMITTCQKRWPIASLTVIPCLVQGQSAAPSIVDAITQADRLGFDVLLLGRGGGSIEDLWAFNEEQVAQAIYQCRTPIIAGVGHETDTTIADYVADWRAATPTAAAMRATPDIAQVQLELQQRYLTLSSRLTGLVDVKRQQLIRYTTSRVFTDRDSLIAMRQLGLDQLSFRLATAMQSRHQTLAHLVERSAIGLSSAMNRTLEAAKTRTGLVVANLDQLSPLKILARGYAMVETPTHHVIESINDVGIDDELRINVRDGIIQSRVTHKEKN